MDYIDRDKVFVGTLKAPDLLNPFELQIRNCKKIKLHHKEIDIEFELDADKLENIDTIIINGHKYVKKGDGDDINL